MNHNVADHLVNLQRQLEEFKAVYDQHRHDMKQLRQAMGCDGSDLPQLLAAWDALTEEKERLRRVVEKLPTKDILTACEMIGIADTVASMVDGPIPPTANMLKPGQVQACLSALWATREAAQAAEKKT